MSEQRKSNVLSILALAVSVVGLTVSAISLRHSDENSQYYRLLSFEQRRAQVREVIYETQNLLKQLEDVTLDHVATDSAPEQRKDAARIWAEFKELRSEEEALAADLSRIPATPSTDGRLDVEKAFNTATRSRDRLRQALEQARAANKARDTGGGVRK